MTLSQQQIFIDWLDKMLRERGWTDYQLAKRAGISHSVISKARSGSLPKWDACEKIAGAFGVPPVMAFRKAGLLPDKDDIDESLEEANHLLGELPEDIQEEALALIRTMHERHANKPTQDLQGTLAESDA